MSDITETNNTEGSFVLHFPREGAMPCHAMPRWAAAGGGGGQGVALGTKEEGEGRLGHSLNGGRQDRGDQ